MSKETKINTYRRALLITFVLLILVIASSAWMLWNSSFASLRRTQQPAATQSDSAQGPAQGATDSPASSDTPLAPVQLSPQRMQSIGVRIGKVESKPIDDEIRFFGNVQPNERRFAYVQTRFAGWIRQVYADAARDFVLYRRSFQALAGTGSHHPRDLYLRSASPRASTSMWRSIARKPRNTA
jgi:hypothetical protein